MCISARPPPYHKSRRVANQLCQQTTVDHCSPKIDRSRFIVNQTLALTACEFRDGRRVHTKDFVRQVSYSPHSFPFRAREGKSWKAGSESILEVPTRLRQWSAIQRPRKPLLDEPTLSTESEDPD